MNCRLRNTIFILLFVLEFFSISQSSANSVLKSGKWYKIKVFETDIYKITYEDLQNIGFEAPENIRIYGNKGAQLPYLNRENNLEDLQEIALYQNKGNDNTFGPGDYYLFYGEGPTSWHFDANSEMFVQKIHEFTLCNYYFITASLGEGKRIQQIDNSSLSAGVTINTYTWRGFHEKELYNLGNSGKLWFGERYDEDDFTKDFNIPELVDNSFVKISASFALRAPNSRKSVFYINNSVMDTISLNYVNLESDYHPWASIKSKKYSYKPASNTISAKVSLLSATINDRSYIDYITLNANCNLKLLDRLLFFRDNISVTEGAIAKFRVSGANSVTQVWNVTDHNNVVSIKSNLNGSMLEFIAPNSSIQEYVALDVSKDFLKPVLADDKFNDVGWIENQNLHGLAVPELLIVTHPIFIDQANQLAELHREKDNMTVEVVTTLNVYNEFSSGKPDASAIRNFARYLYQKSTGNSKLKYLLLFGDGSFDNRTLNEVNPNYIPTFESFESMSKITSFVTDDFYGMMDDNEWSEGGTLEIGVGRIPVSWNKDDETKIAQALVDKIVSYYDVESMKDWRNQVIFLGDDGEHEGFPGFMTDSDDLTEIIASKAPMFNINKIYLDAYQQISSSTGAAYPEVEKEIQRTLNKGALVFSYMGHGGENGITQEKVLQKSDIENLTNGPYYPLFLTATCQIGRFDNVDIASLTNYTQKISAGEAALLNPYGGAIALLTTTRVVFQSSNKDLSEDILNLIFEKGPDGKRYRLGDIFRLSKNNDDSNPINKHKFVLLGDPAVTLAFGEFNVITDSINHFSVQEHPDTVNALGSMIVSGYVAYDDSTVISDFNGVVQVSVYDKKYSITTNGNDGIATFDFVMQDKLLFHGKASVVNGRFSCEFKLPKDITYSFGKGKISYYAQNGVIDAKGSFHDFYIGGTDPYAQPDNVGPEIKLYMNDTNFVEGGMTNSSPVLLAHISDENGINTTGSGIGHDLVAGLDNIPTEKYVLNDYFEGDLDSYKKGKAYYQLNELEEGYHTIEVKAWDIYNNSSEESVGFYVESKSDLVINKLFCFPNPMQDYTSFQYSHNLPGNHDVTLSIYDLTGRQIYSLTRTNNEQGFVSEPLYWERKTSSGKLVSPGVYAYTIRVKASTEYSSDILESTQSGRLIIIP